MTPSWKLEGAESAIGVTQNPDFGIRLPVSAGATGAAGATEVVSKTLGRIPTDASCTTPSKHSYSLYLFFCLALSDCYLVLHNQNYVVIIRCL